MLCEHFNKCKNVIFVGKCASCGPDKLNFEYTMPDTENSCEEGKIRRPCLEPYCDELVEYGYCEKHQKVKKSPSKRGFDAKWEELRLKKLKKNPLCEKCEAKGVLKPADSIRHISKDKTKFYDINNLVSVCKGCVKSGKKRN